MLESDELTAQSLYTKVMDNFPELTLSVQTIRRARERLGWVSTTPKYCQLIREVNKDKRLKWCVELNGIYNFDNVIWSDESSVQLQGHSQRCYRKRGQPKKLKPKPKHHLKYMFGEAYHAEEQPHLFFLLESSVQLNCLKFLRLA